MTTKHTPGPWHLFHGAHCGLSIDDGPGAFSVGDAPTKESANILCSRYQWPERAEEMEANARLIAAAPDLLEALQVMVRDYAAAHASHGALEMAPALFQAQQAIAIATGDQL